MANPSNIFAIDDIKFITGLDVQPAVAGEMAIKKAIDKFYATTDSLASIMEGIEDDIELVEEKDDDDITGNEGQNAPVVKLVNTLLAEAVQAWAPATSTSSPTRSNMRVRYRIDGVLHEVMEPPIKLKNAIISRLKIMSELDIAERRVPQDGRIKLKIGDKKIDLRVSTLPCIFGEKVVMRILDKGNLNLDLADFGMEEKAHQGHLQGHRRALRHGAGDRAHRARARRPPSTRAWPSSTQPDLNIMTAEDPVEYNLDGINQVQVRDEVGLTFAAALKAFLRQDPNIVMVGEIRDLETGGIATKAALTGHLVLSTLHTNDAPSTDQPHDRHGHRAVPGGQLHRADHGPAPGAADLQELQGGAQAVRRGPAGRRTGARHPGVTRARAARSAAAPATRVGRASTRSCPSPRRSGN